MYYYALEITRKIFKYRALLQMDFFIFILLFFRTNSCAISAQKTIE